jgi:hypothetical protein
MSKDTRKSQSKNRMQLFLTLTIIFIVIGAYCSGWAVGYFGRIHDQKVDSIALERAKQASLPPITQNQEMSQALNDVGITPDKYLDIILGFDDAKAKSYDWASANYNVFNFPDGQYAYSTIYATTNLKSNLKLKSTMAHEYLHYVWERKFDEKLKYQLTSSLISAYGKDAYMQNRVKNYIANGILEPTELFAYYCTETPDAFVPKIVLDNCQIDRSKLDIK